MKQLFIAVSVPLILFFIIFSFILHSFPLWLEILGIILSVYSLYISGDEFMDGAIIFGHRYGISNRSVGTYIISLGAVIDEFAVVMASSINGYGDMSFGTIQGSNVITMVIFLFVLPIVMKRNFREFRFDGLIMLVISFLALLFSFLFSLVPWYAGVAFIALYIIYGTFNRSGKKESIPGMKDENVNYATMAVAIILLIFASEAIVTYTRDVASLFNISEFVSGFIITGLAGSLPEIIMFAISLRNDRRESTVGIVTGTTIYKGALVLGLAILFGTVSTAVGRWSIYLMIILAALFLIMGFLPLKRIYAVLPIISMAGFYILYLVI